MNAVQIQIHLAHRRNSNPRAANGSLQWLATQGVPQISFDVSLLSGTVSDPHIRDLQEANRVMANARLYAEDQLKFIGTDLSKACFIGCSDASFNKLPGGRSQSGQMVMIGDAGLAACETGTFALIDWRSTKQKRACRSTLGAETLALSDTADRLDFCRGLMFEIMNPGADVRRSEEEGHASALRS